MREETTVVHSGLHPERHHGIEHAARDHRQLSDEHRPGESHHGFGNAGNG